MFKKMFYLLTIILLTSCIAKSISQKGYMMDDEDISNIEVGLTSKENALKYLGYPLNKSYFNDDFWIYYSYKMKEVMFFKPKIMDQKVLIVEFDKNTQLVKNMSLYNIDSSNYDILEVTSAQQDGEQNMIKDILKNIGQISISQ